ncbi:MAG: methyltransferase domain-containing protein [Gemmatimonadales bacterium]|nr:methyltransferase domain-containing protein [Gemmatimonadales bacterium]
MNKTSRAVSSDERTASAFARSWNTLPEGSVYTVEQFEDWMAPLNQSDFSGKRVLEMGCGNGSLLIHSVSWNPSFLLGIDLGESTQSASSNLRKSGFDNWKIEQADMVGFQSDGFDLVYCIGVLHHLESPFEGLCSVVANVKDGGKFHCWVYAKEGNLVVRLLVEPLRKLFSKFPWWFTKYLVATPLALPVYAYAKTLSALSFLSFVKRLPLAEYCFWIAKREIAFFRHVIFDQLVTPKTHYIARSDVAEWLGRFGEITPDSIYVIQRNGNSWKFGGTIHRGGAPSQDGRTSAME